MTLVVMFVLFLISFILMAENIDVSPDVFVPAAEDTCVPVTEETSVPASVKSSISASVKASIPASVKKYWAELQNPAENGSQLAAAFNRRPYQEDLLAFFGEHHATKWCQVAADLFIFPVFEEPVNIKHAVLFPDTSEPKKKVANGYLADCILCVAECDGEEISFYTTRVYNDNIFWTFAMDGDDELHVVANLGDWRDIRPTFNRPPPTRQNDSK